MKEYQDDKVQEGRKGRTRRITGRIAQGAADGANKREEKGQDYLRERVSEDGGSMGNEVTGCKRACAW